MSNDPDDDLCCDNCGAVLDMAAHDAEVSAKTLEDFAAHVTPGGDPEDCTTVYDPYDVAELALMRAAGIRGTE